jgi:glycosyltransferase involved in cell wall biosynthesis
MRFLFVTGREIKYQRNDVLRRALKRIGNVETVGVTNRPKSIILNSLLLSLLIIPKLIFNRYDLVFVGFYGQLLMFPVSVFSRFPLLFDAFVSTFDTLTSDRKLISPDSAVGRSMIFVDKFACQRASHVMLDTQPHVDYFVDLYKVPANKFSALPVGCNEEIFFPRGNKRTNTNTRVLYYSSYLPLHGVGTVVQAASYLRDKPIEFRLIGSGQTYKETKIISEQLGLQNIEFIPRIPLEELPSEIAATDICLGGHFGITEKAARVVPGKIYQILAMAKPLIAANTRANLDLLQHEESAYLCSPNDPDNLARAILYFHENPRIRYQIAEKGRAVYEAMASEEVITRLLKSIVEDLVS